MGCQPCSGTGSGLDVPWQEGRIFLEKGVQTHTRRLLIMERASKNSYVSEVPMTFSASSLPRNIQPAVLVPWNGL